ncbi:hypothetical protein PHYC_00391 [Phycisphaerales bacterium]|nr:hypothetical protein PHYC_00391 [Phycisphaerales bacterium]
MGRLKAEFIDRVENFSHRVMDVAETLESQHRSWRIIDQMIGAGSSVGANVCESDEALSRKDFAKGLGIALKELGEARYWLRFVVRRRWLPSRRLDLLQKEAIEIKRILGAMVTRTNRNSKAVR